MSNKTKAPVKRAAKSPRPTTNGKHVPNPLARVAGATPSAQLTATVKVVTAEIDQDTLNKCTDKIQRSVEEAIEAGVREGVKKVLAKLGITELVSKLDATTPPRVRRASTKKQNFGEYMSDKLEEHGLQLTSSGSSKTLHKASPRQRGTLEPDARAVYEDLKANPISRNEDIVKRTGLDSRTVAQGIRYLRGYNARGEKVGDSVLCLPDGDRKRYTTYSVVHGSTFPAHFAFPATSAKRTHKPRKTTARKPAGASAPSPTATTHERVVEPEEQSNG